jgi:hypothetical protein
MVRGAGRRLRSGGDRAGRRSWHREGGADRGARYMVLRRVQRSCRQFSRYASESGQRCLPGPITSVSTGRLPKVCSGLDVAALIQVIHELLRRTESPRY